MDGLTEMSIREGVDGGEEPDADNHLQTPAMSERTQSF